MAVRHLCGHYILLIFLISTWVNCATGFNINQVIKKGNQRSQSKKSDGSSKERDYWEDHKLEFELEFSVEEEKVRKQHWERNHAFIMEHNANESETFELEHNGLSHLSDDEVLEMMGGLLAPEGTEMIYNPADKIQLKNTGIPKQLDWRNYNGKNYMSPIEQQGGCGSCWTYSASACLESRFAYVHQVPVPVLSKQMLLDCVNGGRYGCKGGLFWDAWTLAGRANVEDTKRGQEYQHSYPYTGKPYQECQFRGQNIGAWTNLIPNRQMHWYAVWKNYALALQAAVMTGPVSITIKGSDDKRLQYLKAGHILPTHGCDNGNPHGCGGKPCYHALNVIGWGEERTGKIRKYWLIRNSWGKTWSMGGYGKFERRDEMGTAGTCHMLMQSGYPNVVKH